MTITQSKERRRKHEFLHPKRKSSADTFIRVDAQICNDSLGRVYGLDTLKTRSIVLDDVQGFDALSPIDRYDLAIRMIAEQVEEAKEILRDAGIKPY